MRGAFSSVLVNLDSLLRSVAPGWHERWLVDEVFAKPATLKSVAVIGIRVGSRIYSDTIPEITLAQARGPAKGELLMGVINKLALEASPERAAETPIAPAIGRETRGRFAAVAEEIKQESK